MLPCIQYEIKRIQYRWNQGNHVNFFPFHTTNIDFVDDSLVLEGKGVAFDNDYRF